MQTAATAAVGRLHHLGNSVALPSGEATENGGTALLPVSGLSGTNLHSVASRLEFY